MASRVAGTIPILIAVCLLNLPALAQYGGGSGYPGNPYLIYTAEQLNAIGTRPQDFDRHFKLMADIDLSAYTGTDFNMIGYLKPGGQREPFEGVFDGNGHSISNFTYVSPGADRVGLFGYVYGSTAEIKDLALINPNVNAGTGQFVGALVGRFSVGTMSGCSVQGGMVTGGEEVGGLVGFNGDTIVNCYTTGYVTGIESLGGLVGSNERGIISACYSTGSVSGVRIIGGLAGQNGAYYGGMEGHFLSGTIEHCYSSCDVNGVTEVGGLVGFNRVGEIFGCYSSGAVLDIEPNRPSDSKDGLFGGLAGDNDAVITDCFWDVETSGLTVSAGGTGKTTAQMQTASTFLSWGACGSLWTIDESQNHPRLAWENMPGQLIPGPAYGGGEGTAENPYLIYTAEQLNMIGQNYCHWNRHFKLMDDVDLSAFDGKDGRQTFNVIGTSRQYPFTGVFDGDRRTISHLTLTGEDDLGMFGRLESGAVVRDLGVVDVNISGSGDFIGALVGYSRGDLIRCYSSGTVNGDWSVGGLVGASWEVLDQCYSSCMVTGGSRIGGLTGANNNASLSQCYSTGAVTGSHRVGGLVGQNSGFVTHCYSTAVVGGSSSSIVGGLIGLDRDFNNFVSRDISSSFWDTGTSGQTTSDGGTGKTTAEMQTATTYLEAGWDFVSETTNGSDDIWKIWDGYDYPRLAWEVGPDTPLAFVDINDPGFFGQMSKCEVTNAQYCDFLNAALASGDITVNDNKVEGAGGSNSGEDYAGQLYYNSDGSGYSGYGATNGGAARIRYDAGAFGVDDGFGNHAVTYVSWYGAMAFANYYGYYLPTEDQWQAVGDYDGTYIYGCGQTLDPGIANYRVSEHPDGTMPVGSFGAYGYGMSDMAGNVWEWTSSVLGSNRVFRGGSLGSVESDCAVSIRGDGIPHAAYWDIGFRVCR